jgi:hypothetical protein
MNDIDTLFELLSSDNDKVQGKAFSNLSLLVEKTLIPGLSRQNDNLLNEMKLLNPMLTKEDAYHILERLCLKLNSDETRLGMKVSMACLIGKFGNVEYLDNVLQCLSAHYQSFDNQQAYSVMASINPQYLDKEYSEKIRNLFEKYDFLSILNAFFERGDDHLNQAIFHMFGKMKSIMLMDEAVKRQYNAVILCYLHNEYEVLDYEDADGIINLLDCDVLLKGNPEETKAIMKKYSVLEVFDNLIGRDNEVYLSNLRKQCPEELRDLIPDNIDDSEHEHAYEKIKNRINHIRDILLKNDLP